MIDVYKYVFLDMRTTCLREGAGRTYYTFQGMRCSCKNAIQLEIMCQVVQLAQNHINYARSFIRPFLHSSLKSTIPPFRTYRRSLSRWYPYQVSEFF